MENNIIKTFPEKTSGKMEKVTFFNAMFPLRGVKACNDRASVTTDCLAAKPLKVLDVGERSRVAASVTHGRTVTYGCKPR